MPPRWRTRVLAAGLLALVAAELAIAALTALTSGISWAAAVGSFTVTNGAMGLGFAVCGVLLAWHRQGNPVGWLFLAAALADAMSAAAAVQLTGFGAERGWGPGVLSLLASLFTFGWPLAIGLCLPVALLLFPSGRPASTRWRWLIWAAVAEGMPFTLSFAAPGTTAFGRQQVAPDLTVPSYHHLAPLWTAGNLGFPVILALAIVSLAVRYRRGGDAGEVDRGAAFDFDRRRIGHPNVRRVRPMDVLDGFGHGKAPGGRGGRHGNIDPCAKFRRVPVYTLPCWSSSSHSAGPSMPSICRGLRRPPASPPARSSTS